MRSLCGTKVKWLCLLSKSINRRYQDILDKYQWFPNPCDTEKTNKTYIAKHTCYSIPRANIYRKGTTILPSQNCKHYICVSVSLQLILFYKRCSDWRQKPAVAQICNSSDSSTSNAGRIYFHFFSPSRGNQRKNARDFRFRLDKFYTSRHFSQMLIWGIESGRREQIKQDGHWLHPNILSIALHKVQ